MAIAYGGRAGSNHANTNGATQTVTTTASIPSGALILVSVSASNVGDTSNLTSVTDSAGNTYQSAVFTCDGGQNTLTAVWYSVTGNALASGGTVTVTFHAALLSSGESWEITVDYLTGAATASATDGSTGRNGGNAQTGATWDTRTGGTTDLTTTNAADLLWAAYGVNQGAPLALVQANCLPSSGWTELAVVSGGAGNNNQVRSAYNVVAATGSYRAAGSATAGNNGISAVLVAFKAAAGGGTVNGSGNLIANSAVAESGAQLSTPSAPVQANAALTETAAQLVTTATPVASNSAIAQQAAQIVTHGATLAASSGLSVTGQVVSASDTLASNATLVIAAQIVNPQVLVRSDAALVVTVHIETPPPELIANSALVQSGAQLVDTSAPITAQSALAVSPAQIVVSAVAFVAQSVLVASGVVLGQTIPGDVTLTDAHTASATLADALVDHASLADARIAAVALSDT